MKEHKREESKLNETKLQQRNITSRLKPLLGQLQDKSFRTAYVSSHVKRFLAGQIRNLRGQRSQSEFAKILGTTQSVVSRYESPEYGQVTLQTLLDIAAKLDVAVIVRFSSYSDFFKVTSDFSINAQCPTAYSCEELSKLIQSEEEITQSSLVNADSFLKKDASFQVHTDVSSNAQSSLLIKYACTSRGQNSKPNCRYQGENYGINNYTVQ